MHICHYEKQKAEIVLILASLLSRLSRFSFSGFSPVNGYGVTTSSEGSGDLFLLFWLSTLTQSTTIRRIKTDDTLVWMMTVSLNPNIKSLAVDSSEQNVYFSSWSNPINVVRLQANDGSFVSAQTQ